MTARIHLEGLENSQFFPRAIRTDHFITRSRDQKKFNPLYALSEQVYPVTIDEQTIDCREIITRRDDKEDRPRNWFVHRVSPCAAINYRLASLRISIACTRRGESVKKKKIDVCLDLLFSRIPSTSRQTPLQPFRPHKSFIHV